MQKTIPVRTDENRVLDNVILFGTFLSGENVSLQTFNTYLDLGDIHNRGEIRTVELCPKKMRGAN